MVYNFQLILYKHIIFIFHHYVLEVRKLTIDASSPVKNLHPIQSANKTENIIK